MILIPKKEAYHLILMSYWRPVSAWLISYLRENKVSKIVFIINANKRQLLEDPSYVMHDVNLLKDAGFSTKIVDLDNLNGDFGVFSDVDLIYVRGGNTFDLLDSVRKNGFDKILCELLGKGVIYAGSSAGSILPGPNIEIAENDFAPDYNEVSLTDTTGLKLVNYAIFPHWQEVWRDKLNDLIIQKEINYPIKTLTDNQVILIKNGSEKLIEL